MVEKIKVIKISNFELFKGRADSAQRDEQIRILAEINEQRAGRSDNPPSYGDLFPAEQPNL